MNTINYVFFGGAEFSLYVLDELEKAGMLPTIVVTTPDKPQGRGLVLTPTPVKEWALKRGIPVSAPAKLDANFSATLYEMVKKNACTVFIVAAYGKIIPQSVLDIPSRKTLNVHPSLLPHYRGASPLQSAMLDDMKNTGVTIMRIDELMDHGPIVVQKKITIDEWPPYAFFEETMAREGGRLLASILPDWIAGKITETPQDENAATFTKKIKKEDGLIDFATDPYSNFRKIQAYQEWPTAYFFTDKPGAKKTKIRVKITRARWVPSTNNASAGSLVIEKVIPEGKSETDAAPYLPH
jgi:methionyl-tRNA formyltransferase